MVMEAFADLPIPQKLILFTQQLLRRKYSETDIAKIWGGNWLRVMRQVQESVK